MRPHAFRTGLVLALLLSVTRAASSQDVVELGRVHGTTPPASYFRELARNPRAFQFSRALLARNPRLRLTERLVGPPLVEVRVRRAGAGGAPSGSSVGAAGPRGEPVAGAFTFPLLLGYFGDMPAPPPFDRDQVQREFFDGPNSRFETVPEFYAELSGGRVQLGGVTFGWKKSPLTQNQVTGGVSGLGSPSRVGDFIISLLEADDDGTVDWGQFDNDGPDGVPNSGDDDGFVDVLTVFQPTAGAECGGTGSGNRVWSHKWSLRFAAGRSYQTRTAAAGGGNIRVDDYTIQPMYNCGGVEIVEIGVFAHELGHGFGLPDLYCTASGCQQQGIGRWGLMAGGSWGCSSPSDPSHPCHMSAWSKAMLGWVDVEVLPPGQDLGTLVLEPVETSGRVLRIDAADGSGEYYLLENRQRIGSDLKLFEPGLLVWQIDQPFVELRWPGNAVNATDSHLGVWLRQADGLGNIEDPGPAGNRGDGGDPFPGTSGARAFHAGTNPASLTHDLAPSGLTVLDIARAGTDVTLHALTRFQTVQLRTEGETTGGLLAVDGVSLPGSAPTFEAAPFQRYLIEAAAGEPLGAGRRRAFEAWTDDAAAPRVRSVSTGIEDAEYVARYGNEQLEVAVALDGGQFGVPPGRIVSVPASPDLWFEEGTQVSLTPVPTPGFAFLEWTGALQGQPVPAVLTVAAPVQAGASFAYTFGLPKEVTVALEAAREPGVTLTVPDGTPPFEWRRMSGVLPRGVTLTAAGRIEGTPMAEGSFPLELRITDGLGLEGDGRVRLEVGPPALTFTQLTEPLLAGGGGGPDPVQLLFFDLVGNVDGRYDVGDLRSFLMDHPELPGTTSAASGEVAVPVRRTLPGGER